MSDEEFLDRIGLDPETGLRDVTAAIGPMLLGRLRKHARIRRYGDAEVDDVFQDALLQLLRPEVRAELSRRAGAEILPWLSRWGYWRLDDAARKRAAETARAPAPVDPAPVDPPGASETASVVAAAVARLSPRDQSILRWRYEERASNAEIGKRLDLSEGAAKKAAHDARERLRKILDDAGVRYEMMRGDSVTDSSDSFDEFLYRAYESGVGEPEYEADLAEAEAIRPELVTSILAQARRESPRILAERIIAAGDQAGWSAEDLAYEAVNEERVARQFLSAGGDPRQLSPRGLAHLLWTAGLERAQWRELLAQAVAGYVVGAGGIHGGVVWGRTSGLAGDQRADALLGGEAERDPVAIGRVAGEYVEEVIEAWMSLRRRAGGGPPLSG